MSEIHETTQSTAVLHKCLNDELKLLCLLQFLPEVAQNSLRITRVFHVQRNPRYSRWSGLVFVANRLITAWACTARSHLEVSGALVIGSTRRCVVWCVGVSIEPALSIPARHNARYVVVAWITTPVNAAVVITRSRLLRESDYLFRECCSRCRFQSSSASSSRFSPPSSFVNGHVSTMWFMVCRWPQSQEGDWARPHLCKLAWYEPWPVRKRFIRNSLFDAGKGISGVTYLNMPGLDGARST